MKYSLFFNYSIIMSLFLSSIFTACKKETVKEEAKPQPAVPSKEIRFSRTFNYVESSSQFSTSYPSASIEARAVKTQERKLVFVFDVPYPKGNDYVSFSIEENKIKSGYIGEYTVIPYPPGASTGDAAAFYIYSISANSSSLSFPGQQDGKLNITSYDSKTNMLNGDFNLEWTSNTDPTTGPAQVFKTTKITLTGSFKNLLLE